LEAIILHSFFQSQNKQMKTSIAIQSSALISPFQELEMVSLTSQMQNNFGNQANAIEPNYKDYIPAMQSRRMSRILKMTWVAAEIALKRAQIAIPESISVASSMGCLSDTIKFLQEMIENEEEFMKPTAFINSTHNTLAGYLAIGLKSKGQNFTFTHKDLNFEHTLLEAAIRLNTNEVQIVLIGAVEEITTETHTIRENLGLLRSAQQESHLLFEQHEKGYIEGETAAFMVLQSANKATTMPIIQWISFHYDLKSPQDFNESYHDFLLANHLQKHQIQVIIGGNTGDSAADKVLNQWVEQQNNSSKYLKYKHISGEFASSGIIGIWLGSKILEQQNVPNYLNHDFNPNQKISRIAIINHNGMNNYSFILLSSNDTI